MESVQNTNQILGGGSLLTKPKLHFVLEEEIIIKFDLLSRNIKQSYYNIVFLLAT